MLLPSSGILRIERLATEVDLLIREGAVILMVASCNDGHGGESFMEAITVIPEGISTIIG